MQAHILSLHTPSAPVLGPKGQNVIYESSHVAYLIKGNGAKNTIQAHILSLQIPLPYGSGLKVKKEILK